MEVESPCQIFDPGGVQISRTEVAADREFTATTPAEYSATLRRMLHEWYSTAFNQQECSSA